MTKLLKQAGQVAISIPIIIAGIGFIVAPIISYFSAQAATQEKIADVSERVRAVETFVPTIDKRLENIERALNIQK